MSGDLIHKDLFIINIDGCIIDTPFSDSKQYNNVAREIYIRNVIERSKNLKLYDYFIKFYQKWVIYADSIHFIAKRKESELGNMTKEQLECINRVFPYNIIYFPEEYSMEMENNKEFFSLWKLEQIKSIIDKYVIDNNDIVWIFDNTIDYYSLKIEEFFEKKRVFFKLVNIKDRSNWFYYLTNFRFLKKQILHMKDL